MCVERRPVVGAEGFDEFREVVVKLGGSLGAHAGVPRPPELPEPPERTTPSANRIDQVPVPVTVNLNAGTFGSLVKTVMTALRAPLAVGLNLIVNSASLLAMTGWVRMKSPA